MECRFKIDPYRPVFRGEKWPSIKSEMMDFLKKHLSWVLHMYKTLFTVQVWPYIKQAKKLAKEQFKLTMEMLIVKFCIVNL